MKKPKEIDIEKLIAKYGDLPVDGTIGLLKKALATEKPKKNKKGQT